MTEQQDSTQSFVDSEQKATYIQLGSEYELEPQYQPKRRYSEKTVRGVVVGRGENRAVIPVEEVRKLAALHCSYKDMAEYFGVKETTFRDHFRRDVERARHKLKHRLSEAMIENAINRMNPTMQIWLSKQWLGMNDGTEHTQGDQVLPWLDEE